MAVSLQEVDQELDPNSQQRAEMLTDITERAEANGVTTRQTDLGTEYGIQTEDGGVGILLDEGQVKAVQTYGEEELDMELYGDAVKEAAVYSLRSSMVEPQADQYGEEGIEFQIEDLPSYSERVKN